MELYGIEVEISNKPALEEEFIPIACWNKAYLAYAKEPFAVAITAGDEQCVVYRTHVINTGSSAEADRFYVNRLVKTMLWLYGGYKISVTGSMSLFEYIRDEFSLTGGRKFDVEMMTKVYGQDFRVELLPASPHPVESARLMKRHLEGHRIGFSATATERKVAAVSDGKVVYTEEVLWNPVKETDPTYHYRNVRDAFLSAAKKLPRIDGIGVSSAGIFRENQVKVASLFRHVAEEQFEEHIRDIYIKAAESMNCENLQVLNNGDVTALAGAMSLDANGVLGITMGNSQAVGFVDEHGKVKGWLNELAFAPVDVNHNAVVDEWSGDVGCGVSYFSQQGLLRLAYKAGIRLNEFEPVADNIRVLQVKAEQGDTRARLVFTTIGTFLGHTLALYHNWYQFQYVLLLGKVMLGAGGDMIFNGTQKVLAEEYPEIASQIVISLPEENERRVGQTTAAASLPDA